MALNNPDQAQIRQYLLGKLSETEQEKIEERLMVEDEFFDEFEASTDELVEEYCAGDLERGEREWFETHYLASAEGRQRHAFALTMDHVQHRQAEPPPRPAPGPDPSPSFFARLAAFAKTQPWTIATVTALVLIIGVAFIWFKNSPGEVYEATLTTAVMRRGGTEAPPPTRIQLPSNTSQLKLHLQLPKPAPAGTRYTAVLDDRVNTNNVEVVASDPELVTVTIPRKQIPHGWYTLELTVTAPSGTTQQLSYPFNVE